jgi:hypothetical protein
LEDRLIENEEIATIPRIAGGYNPVFLAAEGPKRSTTWDISLELEKGAPTPNVGARPVDANASVASEGNTPVAFVRNSTTIWFNTLEDDKSDLNYNKASRCPAEADRNTFHQATSQKANWEKGE